MQRWDARLHTIWMAEMVWNNELVNARIDGGRSVSDILYIIDEINAGMQDEEAAE